MHESPSLAAEPELDPLPRTPIGVALRRLAEKAPNRPAVTFTDTTLTRSELESRTNRLARAYRQLGVRPGSFVTIALPTGAEFLESVVAVWKAGATPQPVSNKMPPRELNSIIELADPDLVVGLTSVEGRPFVAAGFTPSTAVSDSPMPDAIAPSLKAPTSGGSTGRPKLIVSTQEATAESLVGFGDLVGIPTDGVLLSTGPLSHNGPLLTTAAALFAGCHVVIMERFDAEQALALVARHRVQWMYSVPTMLNRIAALPERILKDADLSSLRTIITMAANCPPSLRRFCLDYFGPSVMLELYAATEAHAIVLTDGHGWIDHPGSVGRPVLGEIQVRDADGTTLSAGEVGELWMRRSVDEPPPYRYIGSKPQRSEDGWETVGDLGRIDSHGYLYLADRKTDMIVVGGSNVYPAEIEAALEEHSAITAACVVGLPDAEYGSRIHAVLNVSSDVSDDELFSYLRERLVPYKLPRTIERVDLPLRDEAGKTRRSSIRDRAMASQSTGLS